MKTSTKESNGHNLLKENIDIAFLEKIWKIDNPKFTFNINENNIKIKGDYIEYTANFIFNTGTYYYLISKYIAHLRDSKINEIFKDES